MKVDQYLQVVCKQLNDFSDGMQWAVKFCFYDGNTVREAVNKINNLKNNS